MAGTIANVIRAAVDTLTIDSIDVGFTKEPYELSVETVTEDVYVEQFLTPIRTVFTQRNVTGTVSLAESTLANMALVFGMPASNISGSTLTLDNDERGEVTFVLVGKSGSAPDLGATARKRTFSFPQTKVSGAVTYNVAKLVDTTMAVEFTHGPDSNGTTGTIVDSAA